MTAMFNVTVKKNTIALTHLRLIPRDQHQRRSFGSCRDERRSRRERHGQWRTKLPSRKMRPLSWTPMTRRRYALDKGVDTDDLDQWSTQRDDALSTYASAGPGYAQSPYQYGASDLNYYGQYYDVPGYGEVWQPNNVGYNWDPFSNGYWSYSPGFGYTWVSSYPWGWMPYRYGRWVFVNGRGWFWAPGGWNRWYSRPRLVNAPPGFRPPLPPADKRIVDRNPGRNHHEPPPGNGGGRTVGPVAGQAYGPRWRQSMLPASPMETEATSASTPMMMWHECRGLTIRHRSQSRTLTTIMDELRTTAIRK